MNVFFFFCRVVIDAWVLRELTFYTPVSTPKNWNILVPHIKMTPHSETRPSRTLYPPNAQFPYRQAVYPAQTKRNAPKHQHQRGNGHTRRQARHRRCPQARQQGRSRFRSARKAQTQAEIIAPITEATKQPHPASFP